MLRGGTWLGIFILLTAPFSAMEPLLRVRECFGWSTFASVTRTFSNPARDMRPKTQT